MNRQLKIISAGLVILTLFTVWFYSTHPLKTKVTIHGHDIYADIALTGSEKALGLGNRTALARNRGMLFVYDHKERYPFWMKGMNFPLDYIWIDDKVVVDLSRNVPVTTSGRITVVEPRYAANKVLEVNAGTIDAFGIQIGDPVIIRN